VLRLVAEGTAEASQGFLRNPDDSAKILAFAAANPGTWGDRLQVRLQAGSLPGSYLLRIGFEEDGELKEVEAFSVTLAPGSPEYVEDAVNDASRLVRAEMQDVSAYLLGMSRSQDLSDRSDLTPLNDRTMTVSVDGTARSVEFAADAFDGSSTLADAAALIEQQVRGSVVGNEAVQQFTCRLEGSVLVLTSGSRAPSSSVVVTGPADPATDAASFLRLGKGNDGTERTGQESLDELVSGIPGQVGFSGGANGDPPSSSEYETALTKLEEYRDVNIVCLPGLAWENAGERSIIDKAVAHARKMMNRMVIIDPPCLSKPLKSEKDVSDLQFKSSTYSSVYYPWLKAANPFYHPERNPGAPRTLLVAPSGAVAGIWARTDGQRGVWKAPAGVETVLNGIVGLQFEVGDGEQDALNPSGINVLRRIPGAGPVVWGSRTLATRAVPEWRYIPVRRTALFIEESIRGGIQWAVFEPNDHRLWSSLRLNIGSFMNGLFQSGAFQGRKASEAYFVRCGLGDTMTQGDIDRGQVIVIVGFAPLKPAEFVIVRIQQKAGQS
jgi:hypothetical protein